MIKSELEIEQDVYNLLKIGLKQIIKGKVYKSGCRPMDAHTEDAVIIVSDADADQIQSGHVLINMYVPNIGDLPDKKRLTELSKMYEYMRDLLSKTTTSEYNFELGKAIQTYEEPDISQHFVNYAIKFKRTTF